MTVEQLSMLAKIFLALTILGIIGSMCMFFLMDIRKAFHIVTKSTYRVRNKKEVHNTPTIKGAQVKANVAASDEFITRVLDMSMQGDDSYEPTAVLGGGSMDETTILGEKVNKLDLIVDITYVHSEVII